MSTKPYRSGLVVGKFAPLHQGHRWLIDHAAARCDRLQLLSYTNPEFAGCSPEARRRWLADVFPQHEAVVLSAEEVPPNDAPDGVQQHHLALLLRDRLGWRPDAMFASETYVHPCARVLSETLGHTVDGLLVDPHRTHVPISATQLRAAPARSLPWLPPAVRADFVPRIVLLGGESTGKTTLAAALAERLGAPWVAEYGRERWEQQGGHLDEADLLAIAVEQVRREDEAARSASPVLLCDTSPLTTVGYAQWMLGHADPALRALADRPYALTVLCGDDLAFVQDGTRRDEAFRAVQQAWYRAELTRRGQPWVEATGSLGERVARVVDEVGSLLG